MAGAKNYIMPFGKAPTIAWHNISGNSSLQLHNTFKRPWLSHISHLSTTSSNMLNRWPPLGLSPKKTKHNRMNGHCWIFRWVLDILYICVLIWNLFGKFTMWWYLGVLKEYPWSWRVGKPTRFMWCDVMC
jgi:hypothetical protein